ncbi:protein kinase [Streptomyces sp. NPDC050844]|uniref:serine/threonine-protein kinase n=1 Tax=Streptomyces sp. NPDC050844 TaxID=3155790 RepID=UPI0033C580A4
MQHARDDVLKPLGPEDPREISGYRIAAKIGEGGMGAVYFTRTRGGQPVALKLIRREFAQNPDFRARFEAEVQAARRVSGYHIVPVVDHDMGSEQPWIASAYVPGLPLDEALASFGPLPLPAAFQLIGCTAHALGIVHAASVIHRDLKPSNILLGSQGPWVIDFGIARATDTTQLTQTGGFIGTPQFMSPEHALGQKVTPATDVFALGLIAAMVATGRHPYGDGSGFSIAATIANTEQRPPDLSGYPDALRPLLETCLAADPAQRPLPATLADWCAQASGRALRDFSNWLPAPLAQEIARREQAAEHPPEPVQPAAPPKPAFTMSKPEDTAGPSPHAATYIPTQAAGPQTPQTPQVHAAYAPTQAAPPPPHAAPHGPQPWQNAAQGSPPRARKPKPGIVLGALAAGLVVVAGGGWAFADAIGWVGADPGAGEPSDAGSSDPANARYEVIGAPQTVQFGSQGNASIVALDLDKNVPVRDKTTSIEELQTVVGSRLSFKWGKFGKSEGPTPQQCARGVTDHALGSGLDAMDLNGQNALLVKGDILCGTTSGENLAMLKITDVKPYGTSDSPKVPGFTAELTLWKTDTLPTPRS